jgi:hypothetical protein
MFVRRAGVSVPVVSSFVLRLHRAVSDKYRHDYLNPQGYWAGGSRFYTPKNFKCDFVKTGNMNGSARRDEWRC